MNVNPNLEKPTGIGLFKDGGDITNITFAPFHLIGRIFKNPFLPP